MSDYWLKVVGANVRRLRLERRLTQNQLLMMMGSRSGRAYLSLIEKGRQNTTVTFLISLADALAVTPAELLTPPPLKVLKAKRAPVQFASGMWSTQTGHDGDGRRKS